MKKIILLTGLSVSMVLTCFSANAADKNQEKSFEWRAGTSSVIITPGEPTWMAGYSSRDRPSEGKIHDLWAKALAIEDESGNRALLVTADIRNFPKNISDRIRNRIEEEYGLTRAQVILNGSHTHTGPLMYSDMNYPYYISKLTEQQRHVVAEYSEWLVNRIVELAGNAIQSMEPAHLFAENGVTRFAVNRRNNPSGTIEQTTELAGPTDYSVPVLKVTNQAEEMIAIVFGYACHPTVLAGYEFSGDYPGFAQIELENKYPGITALFFQGAGGDQNPLPRRSVALAEQYGRSLAAAVKRVLQEEMRPLESQLSTAYNEVDLPLKTPPTKQELEVMIDEYSGNQRRWASWSLEKLQSGESLITSYPYPIQVWRVGHQPIFSLGGELVVDYAIELKRMFGYDIFVMGYSNDVMSYIPTARILREGGYEGASSQWVRGMPSLWKTEIETLILEGTLRMAENAEVPIQ